MWQVILVTMLIGALAEACLGKASRAHWEKNLSDQNKRLLKASTWLTLASVIGLLGVQLYFQGVLMFIAGFIQMVAGAFLMQRMLAKTSIGMGVRLNLALFSGPVSITLLMLVIEIFK